MDRSHDTQDRSGKHSLVTIRGGRVTKIARTALGARLIQREASVLAQAKGRWGAPRLLSYDQEASRLVCTAVPGLSIAATVTAMRRQSSQMSAAAPFAWLELTAQAVDIWHAGASMVHGDVSPSNLVLCEGRCTLIDFALATPFGSAVLDGETVLANPSYASPEQMGGAAVTRASDIFSLAAIASELLTGHRFKRADPARNLGSLPKEAQQILLKACSLDPRARPASCQALMTVLGESL